MITYSTINFKGTPGTVGDCAFGNKLFKIASTIGIAEKNGYRYGFPRWDCQEYFVNPLPRCEKQFKKQRIPANFAGLDFGFYSFGFRDDIDLFGELASYKYFEHCQSLIKHYFELKQQCKPYKDYIIVHYRDYNNPAWANLTSEYYREALKKMPDKPVLVVTDSIDAAVKILGYNVEYTSNTPIVDFYIMATANYLVMANSTFSWWGAFLSEARIVTPSQWYDGVLKNAPKDDMYLPNWIIV